MSLLGNVTALAAVVSLLSSGEAFAYCSEPSAPYCANSYSDFSDENEFESCKRDMEDYGDEVNSYVECLQREVDAAIDEARRNSDQAVGEYNDAVDSFNRRAGY